MLILRFNNQSLIFTELYITWNTLSFILFNLTQPNLKSKFYKNIYISLDSPFYINYMKLYVKNETRQFLIRE